MKSGYQGKQEQIKQEIMTGTTILEAGSNFGPTPEERYHNSIRQGLPEHMAYDLAFSKETLKEKGLPNRLN